MISAFHCRVGEYQALKHALEQRWQIATVNFSRNQWHITAVRKEFLAKMPEEKRQALMRKLAYGDKKEKDDVDDTILERSDLSGRERQAAHP